MTLLKRGSAFFAALLLTFHLVTYPARAASVILPAAGLALTVTAFLNLAGIYPFDTESSFGDWSEGGLADLIQQYNDTNPAIPINGETIHSYLYCGTAILTHNAYEALRAFVSWIKETFSLVDNEEGVRMGDASLSGVLPVYSPFLPSYSDLMVDSAKVAVWPSGTYYICAGSNSSGTLGAIVGGSSFYIFSRSAGVRYVWGQTNFNAVNDGSVSNYDSSASVYYVLAFGVSSSATFYYPSYATLAEAIQGLFSGSSAGQFGVTVDTSTVSVPPELPAAQEYVGLSVTPGTVEGVAASGEITPQAVQQIIQQGVTERQRPVVKTTEVEIAPGVDVDGTTGAVTENPVVIMPDTVIEEVVPSVSELAVPQAFLDSFATSMQTKFPFCVPFDIARLFSAFVFEPVAPVIDFTFHESFTDEDYHIMVDLSPWDEVAAIVRQLQTLILVVGYSLAINRLLLTRDVLSGDLI